MLGIFEYQVNKLTKGYVEDMHQFMNEAFIMEAGSTQIGNFESYLWKKVLLPH